MRIPQEKIDEVRAAADIVEVVGRYVRLKRRGVNYFGLSPFKTEKTPSFAVHPGKGIFKCFSTGIGGNVFTFIEHVEGVSFVEAVRMLAEWYRISLPAPTVEARDQASEADAVYAALRWAGRFFYTQLTEHPEAAEARAYLQRRGFTPATIKAYGVGYAVEGWDALLRAAARDSVPEHVLEQAGLVIPRREGDGYYDRYRGRVMFPIFSHVGKVVGFGGRILRDAKDQPKYINSPETLVYHKSSVLYGLYQGRQEIRSRGEVLLVEGYTDVLALHQAGIRHAVATCGTSLTPDHLKLLRRYAQSFTLLFDADRAGYDAALRALGIIFEQLATMGADRVESALEEGLSVYVLALPAGEDPDSYVRTHGKDAFLAYLEKNRQDFIRFRVLVAQQRGELDTPEGTARVQGELLRLITRFPNPLLQEQYVRHAARVFGVPDIALFQQLARLAAQEGRRPPPREMEALPYDTDIPLPDDEFAPVAHPDEREVRPLSAAEQALLRLMLEHGNPLVEHILGCMALEEFTQGPSRTMISGIIEQYTHSGRVTADVFLGGTYGNAVQRLATDVMVAFESPSTRWGVKPASDPISEANDAMKRLKLIHLEAERKALLQRIHHAEQTGAPVTALLEESRALKAWEADILALRFLPT